MADPTGFLKFNRTGSARRPVPLRLLDWREVHERVPEAQSRAQATRCMDCGVPFCHDGCPLGNLIPEWNDLVREGRWGEAHDRLHATNNFPEFTGRLCPAPCEGACVLDINDDAVTIKDIELEIAERGFDEGRVEPVPASFDTGMTVAVVGSGPAGLAAAQQLTRAGHRVTVFERDDRVGGLMRYGVPEYKMEKHIIDRRVEQLRAEGTVFRTGTSPTGWDLALFDAVILATGTPVPRELPVEGRGLAGVHQAMDYLTSANRVCEGDAHTPGIDARGRHVVIIGGGDTGTDCFGTALRQGAASVTQFDIHVRAPAHRAPSTPWPTYPLLHRTATAHEEGGYLVTGDESAAEIEALGLAHREPGDTLGQRLFGVNTVALRGTGGRVEKVEAADVQIVDGRRTYAPGTEFEIRADLVLLALGFTGPERDGLAHELGISFDERGRMIRDGRFRARITPLVPDFRPTVYVAGDNGRGQSLIVWAIAEGRAAAAAVDADLMGETSLPEVVTPTSTALRG